MILDYLRPPTPPSELFSFMTDTIEKRHVSLSSRISKPYVMQQANLAWTGWLKLTKF